MGLTYYRARGKNKPTAANLIMFLTNTLKAGSKSFKALILTTLTLSASLTVILLRISRTQSSNGQLYLPSTVVFFTIGFFPILMIALTLLFIPIRSKDESASPTSTAKAPRMAWLLGIFFVLQVLIPLKHYRYSHNTLWTEDERLFTWDMFLAFKGGEAHFHIYHPEKGLDRPLDLAAEGLTWGQQNKIFKSPDMILQFAHYISRAYGTEGDAPMVFADVRAHLNGRPEQPFVPPKLDLAGQPRRTWTAYPWVIPMQEAEIQP